MGLDETTGHLITASTDEKPGGPPVLVIRLMLIEQDCAIPYVLQTGVKA